MKNLWLFYFYPGSRPSSPEPRIQLDSSGSGSTLEIPSSGEELPPIAVAPDVAASAERKKKKKKKKKHSSEAGENPKRRRMEASDAAVNTPGQSL